MSEEYASFFGEPVRIFNEIIRKCGRDEVYENVGLGNGIQVIGQKQKRPPYSKKIAFPIDSESIEEAELFVGFDTSYFWKQRNPFMVKGKIAFRKINNEEYPFLDGHGFHPSLIPQEQRERYKTTLIKNLEKLREGLTC